MSINSKKLNQSTEKTENVTSNSTSNLLRLTDKNFLFSNIENLRSEQRNIP